MPLMKSSALLLLGLLVIAIPFFPSHLALGGFGKSPAFRKSALPLLALLETITLAYLNE